MSDRLSVEFAPPLNGWLHVTLRSHDVELDDRVSYTPNDFLSELASALVAFLETRRQCVARWSLEPDGYDVLLEAGGVPSSLRVKVIVSPDQSEDRPRGAPEVVLVHEGDALLVGRTFWRAFRRLESRFDHASWGRSFPSGIVAQLGRLTARRTGGSPG